MVAYRFCRPEDNPYIVQAVNECFQVHFPGEPAFTLQQFQTEIRELDVWPSNCMVASEASSPIAVCVATKRPDEVLISRVGARPGFEGKGHGAHMLTSLSQKLAVLGPPRLVVELPAERAELQAFFEAVGYHFELAFRDYVLADLLERPDDLALLTPIGVHDVVDLLPRGDDVCWERQFSTLLQRGEQIMGWGVVAGDSLAGFSLYRDCGPERQVLATKLEQETAEVAGRLLFGQIAGDKLPVRLVKLSPAEIEPSLLAALGFEPDRETLRYAAAATPL